MKILNKINSRNIILIAIFALSLIMACKDDAPLIVRDTTPYTLDIKGFPTPILPSDNALTTATVQLGKMLFYEKSLSKNSSINCASCHLQNDAFSDIRLFSLGESGQVGTRQAMSLFNLAWHTQGFFWDGRVATLREQSLKPIQDHLEMNETLENVIVKLEDKQDYRDQFIRAFGDDAINSERMGLAMEQFLLSLLSNDSKYDRYKKGAATLTDAEERGRKLYFQEPDPIANIKGAECFHCHGGPNFGNGKFSNNGLDFETEFSDLGRFTVTSLPKDKAAFKVPSLRNIARSAPYMHDGRFQTLAQVIQHYNNGVKNSPSIDPVMVHNLEGLNLSPQDIQDLEAFLHTLTDETFLNNPAYKNPF